MSLSAIHDKIAAACKAAGREPSAVTLVAVSKFKPLSKIEDLLAQGQRVFGENRVQEAVEKFPSLREKYKDLELHLLGPLQSNKVKEAVALFDVIETVDREKIVVALADEMQKQNRPLPCFLQVNTGMEEQKSGVAPRALEKFYRFCREETGLNIAGLMCVPPVDEIPDLHFALLAKHAQDLGLASLSMGMSADFETAIRYGATHIRLGTALFGIREN